MLSELDLCHLQKLHLYPCIVSIRVKGTKGIMHSSPGMTYLHLGVLGGVSLCCPSEPDLLGTISKKNNLILFVSRLMYSFKYWTYIASDDKILLNKS